MKTDMIKFNSIIPTIKINKNISSNNISFQGKKDIISFSDSAKQKLQTSKDLAKAGFSKEEVNGLIKRYSNTEEYDSLINGEIDEEFDGKHFCTHSLDTERDLTPSEAIVYLHFDMDDYYAQHEPLSSVSYDYIKGPFDSQKYDIKKADFLPLQLAEKMNSTNLDIVLSGMILKGKMDDKTAKLVGKYYNTLDDKYDTTFNVQSSEYYAELIKRNLDKLEKWTSTEANDDGSLKSGLSRPLSEHEAAIIAVNDDIPQDTSSINEYIKIKDAYKTSPVDNNPNIIKISPKKEEPSNLQESIDYLTKRYNPDSDTDEFYEDLMALDSNKYFERVPMKTIKFDAMMTIGGDRELRQKNIQVLNSISEELLEKMAPSKNGKKGRFASIEHLLKTKDLDKRVQNLENYRMKSQKLFDSLDSSLVMDYLTDSEIYSHSEVTQKEFYEITFGIPSQKPPKADIIEFHPSQDED